jgi:hypothetical protein
LRRSPAAARFVADSPLEEAVTSEPVSDKRLPELALIPERLWVILDRKSDVTRLEMARNLNRLQFCWPAGDYSASRSYAGVSR